MCKLEQYRDALLEQEEYENRKLVFKVDDNSEMVCENHIVRYNLRMFKGTRKEFNEYYLLHVGELPNKEYMVYDNPVQVEKVEHGACDNNIIYINNNKEQKQRQANYKYLKSSY